MIELGPCERWGAARWAMRRVVERARPFLARPGAVARMDEVEAILFFSFTEQERVDDEIEVVLALGRAAQEISEDLSEEEPLREHCASLARLIADWEVVALAEAQSPESCEGNDEAAGGGRPIES